MERKKKSTSMHGIQLFLQKVEPMDNLEENMLDLASAPNN